MIKVTIESDKMGIHEELNTTQVCLFALKPGVSEPTTTSIMAGSLTGHELCCQVTAMFSIIERTLNYTKAKGVVDELMPNLVTLMSHFISKAYSAESRVDMLNLIAYAIFTLSSEYAADLETVFGDKFGDVDLRAPFNFDSDIIN